MRKDIEQIKQLMCGSKMFRHYQEGLAEASIQARYDSLYNLLTLLNELTDEEHEYVFSSPKTEDDNEADAKDSVFIPKLINEIKPKLRKDGTYGHSGYKFYKMIKGVIYQKYFTKLEDAIAYRNAFLIEHAI
jgi:hypothetical protein